MDMEWSAFSLSLWWIASWQLTGRLAMPTLTMHWPGDCPHHKDNIKNHINSLIWKEVCLALLQYYESREREIWTWNDLHSHSHSSALQADSWREHKPCQPWLCIDQKTALGCTLLIIVTVLSLGNVWLLKVIWRLLSNYWNFYEQKVCHIR